MGHSVHHATYDEKVNKTKVQNYWDEYAAHEDWQEGCSGLSQNIRWIDYICDDREAAEEYIKKHDRGWYDQLAVKFRDTSSISTTSALKEKLVKQIASYKEKKLRYDQDHSVTNFKAEYVSCPDCGSKLARAYLGKQRLACSPNYCPVCGKSDIRSSSVLEQLNSFQKRINLWEKQLKEEDKKLAQKQVAKAKIKWLVKVEWHV